MAKRLYHQLSEEIVLPSSRLTILFNYAIPVLVLLVFTFLPYPESMRYDQMEGDASKFRWVYDRIHANPKPVDMAFIGTSRIMVAVDDEILEQSIRDTRDGGIALANFGVSWQGRNMHALVTKQLLEEKNCRYLVLEVQETLARQGHVLFADLAPNLELLGSPKFINSRYLFDIMELPRRNIPFWLQYHFGSNPDKTKWDGANLPKADYFPFIQNGTPGADSLSTLKESFERKKVWRAMPEALDWLEFRFPRFYLKRIIRTAEEHNVEVIFLFLPNYGNTREPQDLAWFAENGVIWTPPQSILQDPACWYDVTHLNELGNGRVTEWLSHKILGLLEDG